MHALERFRLVDRADDLAGELSHGEQQWLEIAMALAPRPKLLLLDEPTGGMSPEERRVTGELLAPIKARVRAGHRRARPRLHPRHLRPSDRARPGQGAGLAARSRRSSARRRSSRSTPPVSEPAATASSKCSTGICAPATAAARCCSASRWLCPRAARSPCSAATAPARRRC